MEFLLLILHKLQTWILLLCLLIKSDYVLSQGEDWAKINDVVYYGPHYVNEGQPFEILCRMSKFNAPKWTKNEIPIIKTSRSSFGNREGIQQTRVESFSVSEATLEDTGYYRCNSFSRAFHRIDVIPLHPTAIKDSLTQTQPAFEEIVEENSLVQLECHNVSSSKDAKILWYKNGIHIDNDDRRTIKDSKLIIENATSAVDAGDYMCKIDSLTARGGSQFGQIIQLRAPIKVKPFPKAQSVVIGRRHQLECNYTGYPSGKIRWLIGNKKLSAAELDSLGIEIRPNNSTHPDAVLIIRSLKPLHKNSYTCIVNNKFSEDETSVIITVRENSILTNGPILLNESKALNIVCNLTEDEPNWDKARKFIWYKDDVLYDNLPEEDKKRITIDSKDYSLVINKATKSDIGNYICSTGDNKKNATIIVRTKPWLHLFEDYQKTNYKSANIIEGDKLTLKCEVISEYARDASVKWYKYNESEHESDTKYLMLISDGDSGIKIHNENDTKSTLTIDKVTPSDRYYYVCKAENSVSSTNNTILLRVKDKLGALWPFLGIVGEVVVLCTIIFIYEKRRIKPDFDESDNDQNNEAKGTQDRSSKSQDVRQRK